MYLSFMIEPTEMGDLIEEINENKQEIVSIVNLSQTQQLLVVVKMGEDEPKGILKLLEKEEKWVQNNHHKYQNEIYLSWLFLIILSHFQDF